MFELELLNGETYISSDDLSLLIARQLSKEETTSQFGLDEIKPRIVNENGKLGYIDLNGQFTMLEEYQLLDVIDDGLVSARRNNTICLINIDVVVNDFGYIVVSNNTAMEMLMVKRISKRYEQEFKTR